MRNAAVAAPLAGDVEYWRSRHSGSGCAKAVSCQRTQRSPVQVQHRSGGRDSIAEQEQPWAMRHFRSNAPGHRQRLLAKVTVWVGLLAFLLSLRH